MRALLAALRALSALAGHTPRHRVLPFIRFAGTIWYTAAPAAREAVRDNLRHVLHRNPTAAHVRRVFAYGALNYWDTLALPYLTREALLALIDLDGLEHLDAALHAGQGAIMASAHLGSVSLVGQVIPALGYPLTGLLEPIRPPELFDFFVKERQAFGARLLPAGPAAVRELFTALRANQVVGLITDRDISGTGPVIDFFGTPTQFPDGAAAIALRTRAPILPAVALVKPDGRFQATIEPPLPWPGTGDGKRDVLELTRAVARRLEYHVASHPEQWTVFQKRWPAA